MCLCSHMLRFCSLCTVGLLTGDSAQAKYVSDDDDADMKETGSKMSGMGVSMSISSGGGGSGTSLRHYGDKNSGAAAGMRPYGVTPDSDAKGYPLFSVNKNQINVEK